MVLPHNDAVLKSPEPGDKSNQELTHTVEEPAKDVWSWLIIRGADRKVKKTTMSHRRIYKSRFFFILLCVLSSGTYVHNVTESVAMNRDERCAKQGR